MALEFDRLRNAYPNGNWAEMILESLEQEATGDRQADAEKAIALSVERGVPQSAFSNPDEFKQYVNSVKTAARRFAESVAACMTLPPAARVRRAAALNQKYSELITLLAYETMIDPVEIGKIFAEHEAELAATRLSLAISASKKEGNYPTSLEDIAGRFGGLVPTNPYTQEPVEYQTTDDGKHFALTIRGGNGFPQVDFNSSPPADAE